MSLIKQKDSLSCKEIDFTPPITRVIVFLKDEVLLNKIVSKKSRLKDILISGNLDPNGNYILEGKPLDTRKTIIELIPKDSEQLIEIKLFIQLIKLDLQEDNKEIYFSPILKPFENPFRILVFSPDEFTTTFKKYSQNTLKHFKLENFSDTAAAYCNTDKGLYISGGKNKGKGTKEFIKICKFKLTINSLPEIPVRKEYHSMIFVPKNYIYFIGGNSKETFYYDMNTNIFNTWAPLKQDKISPALALINNRYIYAITEQRNKKKTDFIEKTDLSKYPEWEKINVKLIEPFPMHNFGAAVGDDGRIYFLGGRREKGEKIYCYNTIKNIIEPCGQENSSLKISDKNFYFLNEYNSALIPNELRDDVQIVLFNRKKNKFKKIHYEKDFEESIEIKDMTNNLKSNMFKEEKNNVKIYCKKIPLGKMPFIPDKIITFPKLDELKSQIGKDLSISIKAPEIKIPEIKPPEIKKEDANIKINNFINEEAIDIQIPNVPNVNIKIKPKINLGFTKKGEIPCFLKEILSESVDSPVNLRNNRFGLTKIKVKKNPFIKKGKIKQKFNIVKDIKKNIDIKRTNASIDKDKNKPKIELNKTAIEITKPKVELNKSAMEITSPKIDIEKIDTKLKEKIPEIKIPKIEGKIGIDLKVPKIDINTNIDISKPTIEEKRTKLGLRDILSDNIDNEIILYKKSYKYPTFGLDLSDKEFGINKSLLSKNVINQTKLEKNIEDKNIEVKTKIDLDIPKLEIPDINIKRTNIEFPINIPKIEAKSNFVVKEPEIDLFDRKDEQQGTNKESLRFILSRNISDPIIIKKKIVKYPNINLDVESMKKSIAKIDMNIPEQDINIKPPKIEIPKINIDMKVPKIDVDIKGPKININKEETKSHLSEEDIEFNQQKLEIPNVEIEAPEIKVPSDLNLNVPKIEKENIKDINMNISPPKIEIQDLVDMNAPKINAEINVPKIEGDIKIPKVDINTPEIEGKIQSVEINAPKIEGDIKIPTIDVNIPNIEKNIPNLDINIKNVMRDIKPQNLKINTPEIDSKTTNIKIPSINIPGMKIPKIEGELRIPKIDTNNYIKDSKTEKEDIIIPDISPLNIRAILSGKIDEPIVLNKHKLSIPDVTVGVKVPKEKGKLNINIPNIDIKAPKLEIPDINIDKINKNINIPSLDNNAPKIEIPD